MPKGPRGGLEKLISILCLVVLVSALVAPAGATDLLLILPVIGTLCFVSVAKFASSPATSSLRVLDPSISFISLRAPPKQ